jgi:hypothetical protein
MSYLLMDSALTVDLGSGQPWTPKNYENDFVGPIPMRRALYQSRNVPTIRLGIELGVQSVIDEARKGNGAVAALPVADTLKRVDSSGKIVETVDRFGIWRAQTPQAFPRHVIERAHREARDADRVATDDAALCENIGLPVVVVRGSERAVKITEENDFALAEALSIFRE